MEIYATLKVVCLVQVGKKVRVGSSPIRPDPRALSLASTTNLRICGLKNSKPIHSGPAYGLNVTSPSLDYIK